MKKSVYIFISAVIVLAILVFLVTSTPDTSSRISKIPSDTSPAGLAGGMDSGKPITGTDTLNKIEADTPAVAEAPDTAARLSQDLPPASGLWPVKTPPLLPGSWLPDHFIVAFYGNPYSKKMGVLGEFPPEIMLKRLRDTVVQWQRAQTSKKAVPALELIVVSAQATPGRDSSFRMRMPDFIVDSVINMARLIDALVILDFQVGRSTVEAEIPHYEKYLKMPDVHLAVDPEFSMKGGHVPGTKIGTLDASDINFCVAYLKNLVDSLNLPPKLLVVHRFTQGMVTNYQDIKLVSQVQIIMNMDGFGSQALKKDAYRRFIYSEPVEYCGIKLFFKNDNRNGHKMLTAEEVLNLHPRPVYVQYQ